ncbi:anaphase-promoting complex subunit 5-like [Lytechinus pictus]|uniref:anaphase-promoting complex subunit 5-like n=1 Tax=Lytechinus pictus TaxID=7653 RepID=UPI0030BA0E69
MVTPHKISLLILIYEYSNYGKSAKLSGRKKWNPRVSRNFARSVLEWIQGSDMEYDEFVTKVKVIHPELDLAFKECLREITTSSLSSMDEFFSSLNKLLDSSNGEAPVHRQSIIGMFLRRMVLTYDKLSFSQTMRLYSSLQKYINCSSSSGESMTTTMAREDHSIADRSDDDISEVDMDVSMETDGTQMTRGELEGISIGNVQESHIGLPSEKTYTHRQAEHFIAQQANFLQNDESKALPPDVLQKQINELALKNPDLAETYYLSYLNCLRIKEFCGAVHNLHCYFDHMMPQVKGDSNGNNNDQEQVRQNFRYAALNLAGLHCRLGHKDEAMLVLKEAIRVAHQANDNVCLQHALGWLYRLEQKQGLDISETLDHSIAKSVELHLPYLTCLDMQNHTRNLALRGVEPSSVFYFLARTDAVNCQHNQPQLVSSSLAQQSALWFMYGHRNMSSLSDQLLLNMFSTQSPSTGAAVDSESFCLVICNQARHQADRGQYSIAADILKFAKTRFPPSTSHAKIWQECEHEIAFQRALFHMDWVAAQEAINNLAAIDNIALDLKRAILQVCKGERTQALEKLRRLINKYKENKDGFTPETHARSLMVLAQIHILSDEVIKSISYLQEAWYICHYGHLTYLAAMATAHLAQTQILLSMPNHAMVLLNSILPTILTNGSLYDRWCVQFLLARCQCHLACDGDQESSQRKTLLLSAVQLLNQVSEGFRTLGVEYKIKDVAYLQVS